MTSSELQALSLKLSLSPYDLSVISGKSERSARSWLNGTHKIPISLSILLMALDEGIITPSWIMIRIKPPQTAP